MIGVDIICLSRMKDLLSKSLINKTFTKKEQEYINSKSDKLPHYATSFAAKEAVFKALGTGLMNPLNVEIIREESGKPIVKLSGEAEKVAGNKKVFVNMSYDGNYVIGVAVLK
jgi:holo-[acyl-carrier protein] synthase